MLEVFDKNRVKIAILENAFAIVETKKINAIDSFVFSLPDTDPKNEFCRQFNLIKYNNGSVYRIMGIGKEGTETGAKTYECEHVIALLIDTVMFGFIAVGGLGYYTKEVINYILGRQRQTDWILDECDFMRQFEYGWEQENLLAALFSVPANFVESYIWRFNTDLYPYKLSLKRLDETRNPDHYIRKGFNRLTLTNQSDPKQICTRLYPLGAGEGINQLGISELNNGLPYLQSSPEYIDKYGVIERIWTDRRYTDQQSLFDAAQAMLSELQEPSTEYEAQFIGECHVGDIVKIVELDAKNYITEVITRQEEIPEQIIRIANKPKDIAGTVADLADRQRIEMTYSQGATQIYADSISDNADAKTMLELRFYLPDTMININAILLKIRLSSFRAYSGTSGGGGGQTISQSDTTSSGASNVTTTNSGGGTTVSNVTATYSGADWSSYDTRAEGQHNHYASGRGPNQTGTTQDHVHSITTYTEVTVNSVANHSHALPNMKVSVPVPNHTHGMSHTHEITHKHSIPDHTHDIMPVIEFFGNPSSFWLYINGQQKQFFNERDAEIDITSFLIRGEKIPRGTWHTIGILPNALARVEISYNVQGFIQSRGDKTV